MTSAGSDLSQPRPDRRFAQGKFELSFNWFRDRLQGGPRRALPLLGFHEVAIAGAVVVGPRACDLDLLDIA